MPCLTTFAPVPATTMADMVEMLTVLAPSPPVPTMSTVGPGTSITLACSYIVRTRPAISSTVSPLARSATANPAIWASRRLAAHDAVHGPGGGVRAQVLSRPAASSVRRARCGPPRVSPPSRGSDNVHGPLLGRVVRTRTDMGRRTMRRRPRLSSTASQVRRSPVRADLSTHHLRRAHRGPGSCGNRPRSAICAASAAAERDQWWPWPLVISLYSSAVGLGIWPASP